MWAAMFTTVLLSSAVLLAEAITCAARGSLVSGLCNDLQQEADFTLELLQHGGRSLVSPPLRETFDETAKQKAKLDFMYSIFDDSLTKLSKRLVETDEGLRNAAEAFAAQTTQWMNSNLDINKAQRLQYAKEAPNTWLDHEAEWLSILQKKQDEAWQETERVLRQEATRAASAALNSTTIAFEAEQQDQQVKKEDMSEFIRLFNHEQEASKRSTRNGLEGLAKRRVKRLSKLAAKADTAWQTKQDELVQLLLKEFLAKYTLNELQEKPLANEVNLTFIAERAGSSIGPAYDKAKQTAKEKAVEKVFASSTLDMFEWLMEGTAKK